MNPDIYILLNKSGDLYKPATQATALAKYSRSSKPAKITASELSDSEADKFNEKWVIQYGHSSVAELATVPVCFEGVSMIATKYLESYPRGAYSEKSTRYQEFTPDFVWPVVPTPETQKYIDELFAEYKDLYEDLLFLSVKHFGHDPGDPASYEYGTVKAWAFDIVRNILPCGTKTSLAGVYNLRDLRYLIQDLMNSPNPELRRISEGVLEAAKEIVPTLVKDPKPNPTLMGVRSTGYMPSDMLDFKPSLRVKANRRFCTHPDDAYGLFEDELENVYGSSIYHLEKIMQNRGSSAVPDVFKSIRVGFDVIMDFGSFRDLARHRRSEIIYETPNLDYGYIVPEPIRGTEFEPVFRKSMDKIETLVFGKDSIPAEMFSYFVPMGYLHQSRFVMDLKQLYYMVELRTRPSGHYTYRKVCYDMFIEAKTLYPELMEWCKAVNPAMSGVHY